MKLISLNRVRSLFALIFLFIAVQHSALAEDPFKALGGLGGAAAEDEILEPDQAFQLNTFSENGKVYARWQIADGHYLYKDKIKISPADGSGVTPGDLLVPGGELKHDEFFGEIYVCNHEAEANLPVSAVEDGVKSADYKVK